MSNKTSDKNVGSIEEDIMILQEKDCMWHYPETRIEEAIENIIKAYQEEKDSQFELLKRIKELEEERNHWHGCFIVAMENSIAKEKVINVIQEHKDKIKRYKEYRIQGKETDVEYYENIANTIIVQVLQELLREDK